MSLAIYRRYRPTTFKDVLGQDITIKILREAARQDKLSHAYLFSGPRGTGKTTTARIVAKIANCQTRKENAGFKKEGEPCNKCDICKEISAGRSLDIIEIDAASNRGIDEIRSLRENIRVAPLKSQYKVFIIDEAHMLTKDAFNALLKTLEEPPPFIILILATTETEKIPSTISSRTQQFHFKKIPLSLITGKLEKVASQEKVNISKEALELIASAAEGSFRDAESLLDQMTAGGVKKIELDDVEETVGKIGFDKLDRLVGFLLAGDSDSALQMISEVDEGGYNLSQFTGDLIRYLRKVAVLKFSPQTEKMLTKELVEDHLIKLKKHSQNFKECHLTLIKNLINAYSQIRYSQFPIIPLEIAIIESLKIGPAQ